MTEEEVFDLLRKNIEEAKNNAYVGKPYSYALYHTWKDIDAKEKWRRK